MEEIDWTQAPEGTTHAFHHRAWRKVTDKAVYRWVDGDGWVERIESPAEWLANFPREVGGGAYTKPAPKENPLPDGKVWFEHATHYSNNVPNGLFFTEKEYYWRGQWNPWQEYDFKYWSSKADTIIRFPKGVKPQVKQEQPKKPVGWWS